MEKRKAHYSLPEVKASVARQGVGAFTATALQGLDQMGLSPAGGLAVVLGLQPVKITLRPGTVVIQFKEL